MGLLYGPPFGVSVLDFCARVSFGINFHIFLAVGYCFNLASIYEIER